MSNIIRHPYHLVDASPWPLLSTGASFMITSGLVKWMHTKDPSLMILGVSAMLLVVSQWWRDTSSEGSLVGQHTTMVELGLRWGIGLFIVSEVFFFVSFFWAFFHSSLSPSMEIGLAWPPVGVVFFNPFTVPLLNTVILLSSGVSVTWAHHAALSGHHKESIQGLVWTVMLGVYFTSIQAYEYLEASFCFSDGVFGSTFFIATGFHGIHVLVGTLFLGVSLVRLYGCKFSLSHHFGLEAAAWYWHFVDVVWLFLFMFMYWWSSL